MIGYDTVGWLNNPTIHILHWSVHPSYPILPLPVSSYTGVFGHPTLCYHVLPQPSYILPRLTLECSSILPHPTATFFVLHWSVQPSYGIVLYHTSYHRLHWLVQPSYRRLPRPTTTFVVQHWLVQCRTKKGVWWGRIPDVRWCTIR